MVWSGLFILLWCASSTFVYVFPFWVVCGRYLLTVHAMVGVVLWLFIYVGAAVFRGREKEVPRHCGGCSPGLFHSLPSVGKPYHGGGSGSRSPPPHPPYSFGGLTAGLGCYRTRVKAFALFSLVCDADRSDYRKCVPLPFHSSFRDKRRQMHLSDYARTYNLSYSTSRASRFQKHYGKDLIPLPAA